MPETDPVAVTTDTGSASYAVTWTDQPGDLRGVRWTVLAGRHQARRRGQLFCTDTAMTVTTSAVQMVGAVGYSTRYPAERHMREAKVLQIFEGTARRSHVCGQDAESVEALGQRGDRTEMPLVKGQDLIGVVALG